MKNILVPTDFSAKSYNALAIAKKFAERTGCTIHLLHVADVPTADSFAGAPSDDEPDVKRYITLLIQKAQEWLDQLVAENQDDLYDITATIKLGKPYNEIMRYCREVAGQLIIIGEKGYSDSEDFFIGSVADQIIRSSTVPVLTTKSKIDEHDFKNIVYATDLKEEHVPLIELLKYFQELFGATIHVVKINTQEEFENEIDTQIKLEKLAKDHDLKNYTLNAYSHIDTEYGIVYFADKVLANLIALGIHHRVGIRRLISGGHVANDVLDHSRRAILTYCFD